MKNPENIYYQSRMRKAQTNGLFSNRERAALELYVSSGALADYEKGLTVPPCDAVQKMVENYGDHDLRGEHIRAYCPLLPGYGRGEQSHLAQAALGWAVTFQATTDIALQFAAVARDGRITPDELDAAKAIRAKSLEVKQLMEETITAIDNALAQMGTGV